MIRPGAFVGSTYEPALFGIGLLGATGSNMVELESNRLRVIEERILAIEAVISQGIEAFGGDANAAPSRSDESPSGKAGAPNNPAISTPTHKGEEG